MTLVDWLDRLDENMDVEVVDWYNIDRTLGRYDGRNSIDICYLDCEVMKARIEVSECGHGVLRIFIDAFIDEVA